MSSQEECKTVAVTQTATQRLNRYLEKFTVWIVGIVISLGGFVWNKMDTQVNHLEEKVAILFQDKVSRSELKEEMSLIRQHIDRNNVEMLSRQEQTRSDILSRLELILKFTGNNNNNK